MVRPGPGGHDCLPRPGRVRTGRRSAGGCGQHSRAYDRNLARGRSRGPPSSLRTAGPGPRIAQAAPLRPGSRLRRPPPRQGAAPTRVGVTVAALARLPAAERPRPGQGRVRGSLGPDRRRTCRGRLRRGPRPDRNGPGLHGRPRRCSPGRGGRLCAPQLPPPRRRDSLAAAIHPPLPRLRTGSGATRTRPRPAEGRRNSSKRCGIGSALLLECEMSYDILPEWGAVCPEVCRIVRARATGRRPGRRRAHRPETDDRSDKG